MGSVVLAGKRRCRLACRADGIGNPLEKWLPVGRGDKFFGPTLSVARESAASHPLLPPWRVVPARVASSTSTIFAPSTLRTTRVAYYRPTGNTHSFNGLLRPIVVHAHEVRLKAHRPRQKSDRRNAFELSEGLRRGIYRAIVHLPPVEILRLGETLSRRRHFVRVGTAQLNAAKRLLHAQGLGHLCGSLGTEPGGGTSIRMADLLSPVGWK